MEPTFDISQALNNISGLEEQLGKALGAGIWNFSRVLAPGELSKEVTLNALTQETETLVLKYLEAANTILELFNIAPVVIDESTGMSHAQALSDAFNEAEYIIYNLRYAKSLESFSDYQFFRTRTWLENRFLSAGKLKDHPDNNITYTIYIPGTIITTEGGAADIQATATQEQKTDEIKCYFSLFPAADHYKRSLFNELYENSSFGMVPRLFEEQILELCKKVLHTLLYYPVHKIYEYLDSGYTSTQAQNNVNQYMKSILKQQKYSLSPEFSDTDKILDEQIKTELDKIPQLNKTTKTVFAKELKYEAIVQLNGGLIYPNNYYQLDFRKPIKENPDEAGYNYLMDLYLYGENSLNNDFPMETYALILTEEAKENIYKAVGNGQNDPDFTLKDYLAYRPFNELKDL